MELQAGNRVEFISYFEEDRKHLPPTMFAFTLLCVSAFSLIGTTAAPFSGTSTGTLALHHPRLPIQADTYDSLIAVVDGIQYQTNYRTLWNIICTCGLTIFACTWVAVHPNVRGYKATVLLRILQRSEEMLWALFAPEVMVVWAIRQWIGAAEIQTKMETRRIQLRHILGPVPEFYWPPEVPRHRSSAFNILQQLVRGNTDEKESQWTITHSHFLQMGGYIFKVGDSEPEYMDPRDLLSETSKEGEEALLALFRRLTAGMDSVDNIADHSKGDPLAKTFTVAQTFWFIIQICARGHQSLAITQLEVTTLAHAVFTSLLYAFWWHKPVNVTCPIVIVVEKNTRFSEEPSPGQEKGEIEAVVELPTLTKNNPRLDFNKTRHDGNLLKPWHQNADKIMGKRVNARFEKFKGKYFICAVIFIFSIFDYFLRRLFAIARQDVVIRKQRTPQELDSKASFFSQLGSLWDDLRAVKSVPAFYAHPSKHDGDCNMFVGCFLASAFGALHCIAWSFAFHFPILQTLWQISALTVAMSPMCLLLAAIMVTIINRASPKWKPHIDKMSAALVWLGYYSLVPYAIGRALLVGLACAELAFVPPSAHITINWVEMLPHV